jgi:hypothetical protein
MMNRQFLSLVTAALILIVAFTSCKKDSGGGSSEPNNQFMGTWVSNNDESAIVEIGTTDWIAKVGNDVYCSGTYTYNENTAKLEITNKGMSSAEVGEIGNATISGNEMTISGFSDNEMNGKLTQKSGGDGNPFVINAANVIGGNSDIITVKAIIYSDGEYVLVSDKYENNGFILNLPAIVSDKYLYNLAEGLYKAGFKGTISDTKAKMGASVIWAYNIEGERIGLFVMGDMTNAITSNYMYADRNLTIKGYIDIDDDDFVRIEYDYSLKKGWNTVYQISQVYTPYALSTTQKPSNADLKWYYFDGDYYKQKTYDWQNPFFKIR